MRARPGDSGRADRFGQRGAHALTIRDRTAGDGALQQPHEHQAWVPSVAPVEAKHELIEVLRQMLVSRETSAFWGFSVNDSGFRAYLLRVGFFR